MSPRPRTSPRQYAPRTAGRRNRCAPSRLAEDGYCRWRRQGRGHDFAQHGHASGVCHHGRSHRRGASAGACRRRRQSVLQQDHRRWRHVHQRLDLLPGFRTCGRSNHLQELLRGERFRRGAGRSVSRSRALDGSRRRGRHQAGHRARHRRANEDDAEIAARRICNSSLVKTAMFGCDPTGAA